MVVVVVIVAALAGGVWAQEEEEEKEDECSVQGRCRDCMQTQGCVWCINPKVRSIKVM